MIMSKKIRSLRAKLRVGHHGKTKLFTATALESAVVISSAEEDIATIKALLGVDGRPQRLLRSDAVACRKAATVFADAMLRHRSANPNEVYYFATFIDDVGSTSDRTPILRVKLLQAKARRAIAEAGLSGVLIGEMCAVMNYPGGGNGRTLCWHYHAILWGRPEAEVQKAVAALNASRAWTCKLGARPVHIIKIDDTKLDLYRTALYTLKLPHSAKNVRKKGETGERIGLMDTIKGLRPELALRTAEGLSQIELLSGIVGINKGTAVRPLWAGSGCTVVIL
jgi:hypothetical protein